MAPGEPIVYGINEAGSERDDAPNAHFPGSRVGQKLNLLHRLAQVIEHGRATRKQGPTAISRSDTLGRAVEQTHADRAFQIGDRSGNGGLSRVQQHRCLIHAASLYDGHENMQVVQSHATSDSIAQLHWLHITGWRY